MIVDTICQVKALVDEYRGTSQEIVMVWEYTDTTNNKIMFAAYTALCYWDIYECTYVKNPILIYRSGMYIGKYLFMNKVV